MNSFGESKSSTLLFQVYPKSACSAISWSRNGNSSCLGDYRACKSLRDHFSEGDACSFSDRRVANWHRSTVCLSYRVFWCCTLHLELLGVFWVFSLFKTARYLEPHWVHSWVCEVLGEDNVVAYAWAMVRREDEMKQSKSVCQMATSRIAEAWMNVATTFRKGAVYTKAFSEEPCDVPISNWTHYA